MIVKDVVELSVKDAVAIRFKEICDQRGIRPIGMFFSIMESAPCILHAPPHNIAIIDKGKDEEKI